MEYQTQLLDAVALIRPKGRLDAYTTPNLETWVEQHAAEKQGNIVVDLSETNFVDTYTIAFFVRMFKRCRELGGDFVLCNLTQPVQIILELMRLDRAFTIEANQSLAIQALSR